jgi:serine/threonine-protein kinase ATR
MDTLFPGIFAVALMGGAATVAGSPAAPLFREFMGVNGHTVQFRPTLYAPVCGLVRDYHPIDWDFGDDTSLRMTLPMARNGVDWDEVYGSWRKEKFETNACLMFEPIAPDKWRDPDADSRAYGWAFARALGPSCATPLVTSAEVGNEPGKYPDALYRRIFAGMAAGLRAGDPRLTILPCALTVSASGEYAKSVSCLSGLGNLYDALNIHIYALAEGWPTWRRSYPEDPGIKYLTEVREMLAWRDANAPGKPVWVTEFGWDAGTKKPPAGGVNEKWEDVTDLQQAQYLVRSFMVFARLGVARAYIFFFNDEDEPSFHAASGLTRKFQPKPSYHAVAHLYRTLGDYRFDNILREEPGKVYAYRFAHADGPNRSVIAVWSPTGSGKKGFLDLALEGYQLVGVTKMPVSGKNATAPQLRAKSGRVRVPYDESPVYLMLERPGKQD